MSHFAAAALAAELEIREKKKLNFETNLRSSSIIGLKCHEGGEHVV